VHNHKRAFSYILMVMAVTMMGSACAGTTWQDVLRSGVPLTNSEVIAGLKEALEIGTDNAARLASRTNGYYGNRLIRIPFPEEAKIVKTTMEKIGFKSQIDKFVKTMNCAAEEAAKKAAPIFIDAIKQMTIKDGFEILNGPDNAATEYLDRKTHRKLFYAFRPVVQDAIEKVGVTSVWKPIITEYNQLPFVTKKDPNLEDYITDKAIDGLFVLIANEEKQIRQDPAARVTHLLRRVFGGTPQS
jgi:hypothetical protein